MFKISLIMLFVIVSFTQVEKNKSVGQKKTKGTYFQNRKEKKLKCESDEFRGVKRKQVKTSVDSAPIQFYESLTELMNSLPADSLMINLCKLTKEDDLNRLEDEKRNVQLKNVFIHAIKRELDNDFHLIIGDGNGNFFNVENSGLPPENSQHYQLLLEARRQFENRFGEMCSGKYTSYKKPIAIEIEGSLFYDIDHRPGAVGPKGLRPKTAWEVHPITKMIFK